MHVADDQLRAGNIFGVHLPLDVDARQVRARLAEQNIPVSVRGTSVRVSPHVYNEEADFERLGAAIERALKPLGAWVKSITTDNGSEFACCRSLQSKLNCAVYASDPGKPGQRTMVEHANGLIRQYLPKGCDAARLSSAAIKRIQFALNHRPRIRLNGKCPEQVFYDLTGVALRS